VKKVKLFKYSTEKKKCLNATDSRNKPTTCNSTINLCDANHKCDNYNGLREPCKPFFIKPYIQDRRERLEKHHNSIVKIFQSWREIKFVTLAEKQSLYTTVIPFYVDIDEKLQEFDEYGEAITHLSDKYLDIFGAYQETVKKIISHNKGVSEYMETIEERLKSDIWTNPDIHLVDVNYLRSLFKDRHSIEEALESGKLGWKDIEIAKYGALNPDSGVYFDNLFDHLQKQGENYEKEILRVEFISGKSAWIFPALFRSDSREKVIAQGLPGSKSIAKLKEFIETDCQDFPNQLKKFNAELREIETKFNIFRTGISQIIHDYEVLGLKGNCRVEKELSFRTKLVNYFKLMSKWRLGRKE
jgi:hypothetical protein